MKKWAALCPVWLGNGRKDGAVKLQADVGVTWVLAVAGIAAVALAGCAGSSSPTDIPPSGLWSTSVSASTNNQQSGATNPAWTAQGQRSVTASRARQSSKLHKGGGHYKIGRPYKILGKWYTPKVDKTYDRTGMASWYGPGFHSKKTANGEIFDQAALTAAHPTLPLPSYAYVTNLENGRTVLVRINDRGPYTRNRIIDVSKRVSKELGFHKQGVAKVRVKYAGRAPLNGDDSRERTHLAANTRR
ncbi:MAG: septal ring lytic transglycosylase RlpA family protein [Pseudomonadota bacterium]